MHQLNTPDPADEVWDETIALLAGELVALRTRLVAVEAAVGRPGPVGAPAPPTLPALARRIATLERQAGIVPGLDLLAGPAGASTPRPARALPEPPTRGQVWRERGQAALAALVLLAVCVWLVRPAVPRPHPAPPAPTATSAPTAVVSAISLPAATLRARESRCAGLASERCADNDGRLARAGTADRLNPLAAEPHGDGVYDGTTLVGSGVLNEQPPVYRLTFPQPGHYVYVDLEHPELVGEVIVLTVSDPPPAAWCVTAC